MSRDSFLSENPAPVTFVESAPVVVADEPARRAAGLTYWIDGTIGFHRDGDRSLAVAPNGPDLAVHDVAGADLIGGLRDPCQQIIGVPERIRHASGGPILADPDSDRIILVYHGETFSDDDPTDFYSFIGMAVQEGSGRFADLGPIVVSDTSEHDPGRHRPVEVGPGACIVVDGWLMVFFGERHRWGVRQHLGVARARFAEVLDTAGQRRAPVFSKFTGSGWDEPGIGGRSADLFATTSLPVMWPDFARIELLDAYVCVFSTLKWNRAGWAWMHATSLSADGIHWSRPELLSKEPLEGEALYLSIDSGGSAPRTVDGDHFDLYRVRAASSFRWADALVERVVVRFS